MPEPLDQALTARALALMLSIESHGPAAGEQYDYCFVDRARAFESYLTEKDPYSAGHGKGYAAGYEDGENEGRRNALAGAPNVDRELAELEEWRSGQWISDLTEALGRDELDGDGDEQGVLVDHVRSGLAEAFDAGRWLAENRPLISPEWCARAGHPLVKIEHLGGTVNGLCHCEDRTADCFEVTTAVQVKAVAALAAALDDETPF